MEIQRAIERDKRNIKTREDWIAQWFVKKMRSRNPKARSVAFDPKMRTRAAEQAWKMEWRRRTEGGAAMLGDLPGYFPGRRLENHFERIARQMRRDARSEARQWLRREASKENRPPPVNLRSPSPA